jgi:hypothetical protein
MQDWFLQRGKAKLNLAKLLGVIDRWIRRKLQDTPEAELWEVRRSFHRRVKELASLDSPYKNPSMGARYRAHQEHPFRRYLDQEDLRRDSKQEMEDPSSYWGPTCGKLYDHEAVEFFAWKHKERFWDEDYDKAIKAWRREVGRTLPVLPKSGSLPSNKNVKRPPNIRKGSGRGGDPASARPEAAETSHCEATGQIAFRLEEDEIH